MTRLLLLILLAILYPKGAWAQTTPIVAGTVDLEYDDPVFKDHTLYWGQGVISRGQTPLTDMHAALSSGAAQSDIRTLTYEDGSPLIERGQLYYSMTSRTAGAGLCIYRLTLGTGQLELCGIVRGRVKEEGHEPAFWRMAAGHILYHREKGVWQLCASCHAGGVSNRQQRIHKLYHAISHTDLRFGITTLDCDPLDYEGAQIGDEDGQIYYDDELRRWVLVYASMYMPNGEKAPHYVLRLQTSKRPDGGFKGSTCAADLSATGITCSRIGGVRCVLSGDQARDNRNVYRAFTYKNMKGKVEFQSAGELDIDITDGGFRGWNNVTPIPEGDKTRYVLLTFDRTQSTKENNWTYGNLYLYYSAQTNEGSEYDVRDLSGKLSAKASIDPNDPKTLSVGQLHFRRMGSFHPQFDEMPLGKIDLHTDVTAPNGNRYPVLKGKVQYADGHLWAQDGEACILGGTHYAMANYVLPLDDIVTGECRYLYLGDEKGKAHYKVMADRVDEGINITLYSATKNAEQKVCQLPSNTPFIRLAFVIPTETHSTPYRLFVFR